MELLYGECRTLDDAVDFIQFKRNDGWHIMCYPYQSTSIGEWFFLLYKLTAELKD